ncbi:MAG: hypothetical protein MUD00_01885 [Candidatus Pacebacteria bacterium]|jgi:hypothetical protein|nr:hypothetical protein [Candidatus Paceibacterota bacterium]
MNAKLKRKVTGAVLLLIAAGANCAIILIFKGQIPEQMLSKTGSEITTAICGLISLLSISIPWDMLEKEVKPSRRPAPKNHPVWSKRTAGNPKYGTIKQEEPSAILRKVA